MPSRDSSGRFVSGSGGGGGLTIVSDTLTPNLLAFGPRVDKLVAETVEFFSPRVEAAARTGAPWTDQTGNARNGLRTTTFHEPPVRHGIELSHSVPYGIWLETRFEGQYAIIIPTIKEQGLEVMSALRGILLRLRAI